MTPVLTVACVWALVGLTLTPLGASAQQTAEADYRTMVAEAVQEFKAGNWEEARSLFRRAHELEPSARTLRGLGMASFEARKYVEALLALQGALRETRKPLTEKQRVQVEKLVNRSKRFIGRFAVHIQPASSVISVDGRKAVVEEDQLLLDPGEREIVVRAEGYETLTRRVSVDGGSTGKLELVLEPLPKVAAEPRAPEQERVDASEQAGEAGALEAPSESAERDESTYLLPWVVLGASAAVAVTGAVMLALAIGDKSTVENAEKGVLLEEIEGAHDRVLALSTVGAILLGVGTAGLATGVFLLSTGGPGDDEKQGLALLPGVVSFRGSL